VESYSPAPYLATLINCLVWTLYGLPMVHPHSFLVVTINGSGTAIELLYIILFFIFSDRKKRLRVLLGLLVELIFICVLTTLVLTIAHSHKERSLIVGIICILFNVMMYASPLVVMVSTSTIYYHANMVLNYSLCNYFSVCSLIL
jgi:solute carrier family 50 protein (sugar transporter)